MRRQDFYYELPPELIAQTPLKERSESRLLVMDKNTGAIQHRHFSDIVNYLKKGDCLVINDTRVIPARLYAERVSELQGVKGASIEVLLLKNRGNNVWEILVKPGKKARVGTELIFGNGLLKGRIVDVIEDGNRLIEFTYEGIFEEILDRLGQMPLPPYITEKLQDKSRYQTVYAKNDGSAAAPTAGLHFTQELLAAIEAKGVEIAKITLHVGLGTFRPVKEEDILKHHMHSEYFMVNEAAANKINNAKAKGGRIICVGTTSCRTLESVADENGYVRACSGNTEIFIYPGYKFKIMDGLITNFHLPESTLIMLVSAFSDREKVMNAYAEAVKEKYRFFSFGDASFFIDNITDASEAL